MTDVARIAESGRPLAPAHDPLGTPLGKMIEPYRAQLTPFLRDGLTLGRVAAELVLASRRTPNLDQVEPRVLVDAVCRALGTGGMIGRDVFLVPFKDKSGRYEPSLMLSYTFEAALVVQAGGCRSIDAVPVWDDEVFSLRAGTEPGITHEPAIRPKPGRKLVGAYAVAHMGMNHAPKITWLPLAKIEGRRAKSKEWNPQKIALAADARGLGLQTLRPAMGLLTNNRINPNAYSAIEIEWGVA